MRLGSYIAVAVVYTEAEALTGPLTWEPSYAEGMAFKRKKKPKRLFGVSAPGQQGLCFASFGNLEILSTGPSE